MATVLCAIFGAVYDLFSHGVYAWQMVYAFAFPLAGGVLPALCLARFGGKLPDERARQLWRFGISALTVGSLFCGALEIYGTTSSLSTAYWCMGGICLLLAVVIHIIDQ